MQTLHCAVLNNKVVVAPCRMDMVAVLNSRLTLDTVPGLNYKMENQPSRRKT